MILHLKLITLQNNYKLKLLILQTKNNLCLHNLETQITKPHLHIKNIAPTFIEQITPSLLASKNNEMKIKEKLMLDQNLLKNLLYNTFVLLLMTEQNNMIQDIEAEVHHETIIITKLVIPTQDIVLHLEIDSVMTKIPLLHNTHDHNTTIINEIQDLTDYLTGHHTDLLIDAILVPDIDHVHIHDIIIFNGILQLSDHLQDQETLDVLDHGHIHILEINYTQFNHKHRMIPLTSKYACITLLRWLIDGTPTSWFYSLYTHHEAKSNRTILLFHFF